MVPQIISFKCILKNSLGQLISATYSKDVLTSIDDEQALLTGLAKGLQNLQTGEKRTIFLKADQAYGFYDPNKIVYYPRNRISKEVQAGEVVSIVGKSGKVRSYKVLALHGEMVSLDSNHPLAGQDLIFEIETLAVRQATAEEIHASNNDMSVQILH